MGHTVSRRTKTRKRKYVDRKQRRRRQEQVQAQIDGAIAAIVREAIEQALRDEITQLLGRPQHARRDQTDFTVVEARCNKCGSQYRQFFSRAGFYERGLLTFEVWGTIQVPRVSCVCKGMVDVEFVHLVPYGRVWFDVEERARQLAGLCVSLRDSVEVLSWRNRQPLSIATLNQFVNKTADLARAFQAGKVERVPPVVMLDGVWLKLLEPTGEKYIDRKGRKRERHKLRKFPLLVAYGVDPVSGERWLLDWERGREEDAVSWQTLLERLWERGVRADGGLELVVHDGAAGLEKALETVDLGQGVEHQRCVFHKLRNVQRDVQGDAGMTRGERRERRAAVLSDAADVYRGANEAEIRQRLDTFREKWREQEPKAVATLERGFEQTIVYLRVLERARQRGEEWKVECLRTTSALERVQRHFRQKARQVVIFHATKGVEAGIQLVISHRGLATASTENWARLLEEALLAS